MDTNDIKNHTVTKLKASFESSLNLKICESGDLSPYQTIEAFTFIVPCILITGTKRTTNKSEITSNSNSRTFNISIIYCRINSESNNYEARINTEREGDAIADEIEKKDFFSTLTSSTGGTIIDWSVEVNYDNQLNDVFKQVQAKISAIIIDVTVNSLIKRN